MHLKRMELFGFKSFAEKSELSLNPGIAAVIGPNGCGKSNIVDAVRWALGEQSVKSLRGTRMEEIIFSGSDNRKPLNFAEVSLTFDGAGSFLNLDYDEITITRRLFRNGDSEYYINKSPCRLKDITELFLDTGLGKDIYSVIGQGRVDEIINSRPEERREIFEEAAGIFKYKIRKKEAKRRLDETRENLVRVQDLIYELETQVEPLQIQAEVTRKYKNLQQRVQEAERNLLSYRLRGTRDELNKVEKQLENLNEAMLSSTAQSGIHEKELQDLKNSIYDRRHEKREIENNINETTRKLEQKENDIKLLGEREDRFNEQLKQNQNAIERLDLLSEEYTEQKSRYEDEFIAKQNLLTQSKSELLELQKKLTSLKSSAIVETVESKQEEIYKTGVQREAASSTIEELERRLERLADQKRQKEEEELTCKQQLTEAEDKLKAASKKVNRVEEELQSLNENLDQENKQIKLIQDKLDRALKDEQKVNENLHGLNSRLSLLQEQDAALSGYYRGVKEVVQAKKELPGIVGPVGDLVAVDGEYSQAVETALGGTLQYIIARDEKTVRQAISYLKDNSKGWATFLPLDILQQAADPLERFPGWRDLPGVIGKASELVKVDSAFQNAIDYLISSAMVCRTLEDASQAARFVKYSCRIVTLDGELINPGGIMRGGSIPRRNAGMPLGRRREIEELEESQKKLLNTAGVAGETVRKLRDDLTSVTVKRDKVNERRETADKQLRIMLGELENAQREKLALDERISSIRASVKDQVEEEAEINERLSDLDAEVKNSRERIERLEEELADLKEDFRLYVDQKNLLEQQITALMVKVNSYNEQKDAISARIKELKANLGLPVKEKSEKLNECNRFKAELERNLTEQNKIKEELNVLYTGKADLISDLDSKNEELNRLEADLVNLEEEGKKRHSKLSRQEKREKYLSVEQSRLQAERGYQEIRFKELFGNLELADIDQEFEPEESSRIIENLKEDLDALGEVNLGAIDELNRLEDRINFLTEQKDDLQKGEASLHKVLAEIDQRMEHYFNYAFEKINENFKQTFEELFEGGKVLLKLTDEEDILDSGIDIIAQPPGKKLQNITLLSAGEKVLTAIALVFAILRFKPAPFYLLDEVESSLDDANLTRFTKFLKQIAKQAQFILITHRKRTMEEAEVLYGVTMPEPGVSRLMSLKLENNTVTRESK